METRQIITSPAPAAVRTEDERRLRVPSAHWAESSRNVTAGTNLPTGVLCEIGVPKSLFNRRVYCDLKGQNGETTIQYLLGSIEFFLAGNHVLTLPFDFIGIAGYKAYGIKLCPSFENSAGGDHLVSWNPTGHPGSGPIYLAPFCGRLACDKIALVCRLGVASTNQTTTAILACYSEGEID